MKTFIRESGDFIVSDSKAFYEKAAAFYSKHFCTTRFQEVMTVFGFNTRKGIIWVNVVAMGSLDEAVVKPAQIFRTAIINGTARIGLVHNHPSGNTMPSEEDKSLTDVFVQASKFLGIAVLDHLVIGTNTKKPSGEYYSFSDAGILKQ
jgi:DNA repair protein RadC